MTSPEPNGPMRVGERAGRPRDAARHDAILDAARSLLADVGYDRLTIESVAARCGAGKNTVYRRWPGKAALVAAAVAATHRLGDDVDTGSLREDLIQHAAEWHPPDARRDSVVAGLLVAMRHHPELKAAVGDELTEPGHVIFRKVVERAVARGEAVGGHNVELIGNVLPAIIFHHIVVLKAPIDRNLVVSVIDDLVLPALRAER